MGFKWFRARIEMNRVPAETSAVAGSYRSTLFDTPINEFTVNNRTVINGNTKPEPALTGRAVSMPALNNPMVGMANKNNRQESAASNSIEIEQRKSSARTRSGSEINVYGAPGTGNAARVDTLQRDFTENIAVTTPRPVTKMHKAEFKKKKAKAPAPKTIGNSVASGNGSGEFVTLRNEKKMSQSSDIDV